MTTFEDLQQEVLLQLEGYVNDQAVVASVHTAINATDTTIITAGNTQPDGSGLSTGVWEVESELVFVPDYNRATRTASNVVRGWRGTTAASHAAGALVVNNPRFPKVQVAKVINDTVRNTFPKIPAVKSVDFLLQPNKIRYPLSATTKGVLSVSEDTDNGDAWTELGVWRFIPGVGSASIEIPQGFGFNTVRVLYVDEPSPMSAGSDNFETVTGLPSFAREVIVWGAMWRLYSMTELGRGSFSSADQTMMNRNGDFGKATDIAKYLLGMFQQALADAENRMQDLYPARRHYVW